MLLTSWQLAQQQDVRRFAAESAWEAAAGGDGTT